jgi:hypothetical protein
MIVLQWMAVFIALPWLAFATAMLLALLALALRSRFVGVAALAWAAYGMYEYLQYLRITCTGECNIRIDLLVLYPVLLALTLGAVIWAIWRRSRRR